MSDHFSGPRAIAGPAGDICDLYAFPSPDPGPGATGRLVLVMTVLPRAAPGARFSDAIVCRFRLRPVTIAATGSAARFAVAEREFVVDCTFDVPQPQHRSATTQHGSAATQQGRCTTSWGAAADVVVHDEAGEAGGAEGGLRVFAGLRSDPFFIDLPAFTETVKTGRLAFPATGTNSLAGFDVLGVVVEIDVAPLLEGDDGPLFAVVGETVAAGRLPIRLERVGRPEIKNVVLSWKEFDTVNRDLELRDLYNLEDAFHLGRDYRGAYTARFNADLAVFAGIGGQDAWPADDLGAHPLTDLLLADFLVVDVGKPFARNGFFEIERSTLLGEAHTTCGGRWLDDDVMDTLYTLFFTGLRGRRISDGLHRPTAPALRTFPYLAPPTSDPEREQVIHRERRLAGRRRPG